MNDYESSRLLQISLLLLSHGLCLCHHSYNEGLDFEQQTCKPERHRPAALRRRNETERNAVRDAAERQLAIVAGVDCRWISGR
jgi:hypothetical protein